MKDIISKGLLGEVTGNNDIYFISLDDNIITYSLYANLARGTREYELNLDTLCRKCKLWAESKGYILVEYPLNTKVYNSKAPFNEVYKEQDLLTELFKVERVIGACEWIYKEVLKEINKNTKELL